MGVTLDQKAFEKFHKKMAVDKNVVHDAVAEARGEDLALDLLFGDEDRGGAWVPGS
jgi:hypothetical protein